MKCCLKICWSWLTDVIRHGSLERLSSFFSSTGFCCAVHYSVFCLVLEIGTSKVDIVSNNKFHHPPWVMVTLWNKDCLETKVCKIWLFSSFFPQWNFYESVIPIAINKVAKQTIWHKVNDRCWLHQKPLAVVIVARWAWVKVLLSGRQNRTGSCLALMSVSELESVMGEVSFRDMFWDDEAGFCLVVISPWGFWELSKRVCFPILNCS